MDDARRTLWCGNLSSDVADEILFDLFLQAGPLEKVTIPKERDGRSKGYGFVTFKHECSVPYALELMKGISLFGRMINLQNRTGAKVDNVSNDQRNLHHQRSISLPEQGPYPGSAPIDLQSINSLLGMAGLLCGNPFLQGLMPHMSQDMMPPPQHQNHHRSRSYHGGDRYHDGNNRDERRNYHSNNGDRRSRNNGHHGRPRDNDYSDRFRGGSYRDRERDYDDGDRDRDRGRANHRPYDRYRSRD